MNTTLITGASSGIGAALDRKSTRLNSSHLVISYAVFCLKKKKKSTIRVLQAQIRPNEPTPLSVFRSSDRTTRSPSSISSHAEHYLSDLLYTIRCFDISDP